MEYWIGRDGERHGPYREDEIRGWLREGRVSSEDLGWREGLADWQPFSVLFPEERPNTQATPPLPTTPLPRQKAAGAPRSGYAGFWYRAAAYILDVVVLWIPNQILASLTGAESAIHDLQHSLEGGTAFQAALNHHFHEMFPYTAASTLLTWLYFAFCESSRWQATMGKLALGLRVTDLEGRRISLPRALGRNAGKFLSNLILGIGFLMVGWTERKQGLHDMLAGTLILKGRASEQARSDTNADRHDFHV